jgi:disulfide bond formation protein DsbB
VTPSLKLAQRLALGIPALLLGGAYLSEYGFGLYPCELCWWQRYAHFAALVLALASTVVRPKTAWIALAALAILVSGLIGAFHAGVEYGWWEGFTTCSSGVGALAGDDPLAAIMNAPMIRCDVAQWTLAGISLAGFNAIISVASALVIVALLAGGKRA